VLAKLAEDVGGGQEVQKELGESAGLVAVLRETATGMVPNGTVVPEPRIVSAGGVGAELAPDRSSNYLETVCCTVSAGGLAIVAKLCNTPGRMGDLLVVLG
jgi:hypothetical protein